MKSGDPDQALDIAGMGVDAEGIDKKDLHVQFATRNQRTFFWLGLLSKCIALPVTLPLTLVLMVRVPR